jgi:hypothetical protein
LGCGRFADTAFSVDCYLTHEITLLHIGSLFPSSNIYLYLIQNTKN